MAWYEPKALDDDELLHNLDRVRGVIFEEEHAQEADELLSLDGERPPTRKERERAQELWGEYEAFAYATFKKYGRAELMIETKDRDLCWDDFSRAWVAVKYPAGAGPFEHAFEAAMDAGPQSFALEDYDGRALQMLVALCRELQRTAGDEPFFLSCDKAGELLEIPSKSAWRWFGTLVRDEVLELVAKGTTQPRTASRYRYLRSLNK